MSFKPSILVVGDLMQDVYLFGKCTKLSPEAPVPVISIEKEKKVLGGASNVAYNLKELGAKVSVLSVLGDDDGARFILDEFKKLDIKAFIKQDSTKTTSVKTRILGGSQQIVRIDKESTNYIDESMENELFSLIKDESFDAIIFSDYDKGVLSKGLCQKIINHFKCPTLADPKKDFYKFYGVSLITPNLKEAREFFGDIKNSSDKNDYKTALAFMQKELNLKYPLITLSEKGMVFEDENGVHIKSAKAKEVFDVTGAGDSVIASLGYFLASKKDLAFAVECANKAAAIVVGKVGAATASLNEILNYDDDSKIKTKDELLKALDGKSGIVFTNGCFDLLHLGHLSYLKYAKSLGKILVVGLNSDSSIKALKGDDRPVNDELTRSAMLSSLEFVDYVCVFDELTPLELVKAIKPDILVKGKDYAGKEVVGSEYAKKVVLADFVDGYSSTKTIEKIRKNND